MTWQNAELAAPSPSARPVQEAASTDSALYTAISTAQPERLRQTLLSVCTSSDEAAAIARRLLLVSESEVECPYDDEEGEEDEEDESEEDEEDKSEEDEEDEEESDGGANARAKKAPKRLRPRFATCEHCNEEFDVTDNGEDACTWHDGMTPYTPYTPIQDVDNTAGEREPDYESSTWWDWDENCHGSIADQENQYPEGFTYTCCDEPGDADGCNTGPHEEKEVSHKRARY